MEQDENKKLRKLIERSRPELQNAVGTYRRLLDELEELERAIASGSDADERIDSVWQALAAHPRLMPTKAVDPVEDGLDGSRALAVEINRIVLLREEQRARGRK